MLKKAIILSIDSTTVTIGILPDACAGSTGCSSCGMCSQNSANELVKLEVEKISDLEQGDITEIDLSAPRGSVIALVIYLIPLLIMFCGGFLGNHIAGDSGMIIGGIAGFSLSVLLIYILNRTILGVHGKILRKI